MAGMAVAWSVAFLCLVLVLTAAPVAALAQPEKGIPRIGFLSPSSLADPRTGRFVEAFRKGLRELGWLEGQNIAIEYRWAEERPERLEALARQLVSLRVGLIVAATTPAIASAKRASATIPVVMAVAAEPVATGIVTSLARPGGNVTGLSMMTPELLGKKMQLIQELIPNISRVAILSNPSNPSNVSQIRHVQDAARAMHVKVQLLEARAPGEIDNAFAAMTKERAGAAIVLADPVFIAYRRQIADLASRSRVPTVYRGWRPRSLRPQHR
jgi:putative ABC transport system substrate-binding protein